jgi:hypothetical protein
MTLERGVGKGRAIVGLLKLNDPNGGLDREWPCYHPLNNRRTDSDAMISRAHMRNHSMGCKDPVHEQRVYSASKIANEG